MAKADTNVDSKEQAQARLEGANEVHAHLHDTGTGAQKLFCVSVLVEQLEAAVATATSGVKTKGALDAARKAGIREAVKALQKAGWSQVTINKALSLLPENERDEAKALENALAAQQDAATAEIQSLKAENSRLKDSIGHLADEAVADATETVAEEKAALAEQVESAQLAEKEAKATADEAVKAAKAEAAGAIKDAKAAKAEAAKATKTAEKLQTQNDKLKAKK